jgi:hypothetical protein
MPCLRHSSITRLAGAHITELFTIYSQISTKNPQIDRLAILPKPHYLVSRLKRDPICSV